MAMMTGEMTERLLCVLLLVMGGCVSGVGPDGQTDGLDPIKALEHRLSETRGLAFTAEVPFEFENKAKLLRRLEADIEADQGARKREDVALAYAKVGLLPAGLDLKSSFLKFYPSQVQGFYNSKTKKIVLLKEPGPAIENLPPGEEFDTANLVHELTHALQDQHFSLAEKLRPSDNGDQVLALRAIAEADAVLSEYTYRFGGLQNWVPDFVRQIFDAETRESVAPDVPALVADKIRFQYSSGVNFVARFLDGRGWLPLNLMYRYPPLSTEQILHPEKYFITPDAPTRIGLTGLGALFSNDWREIENDTLGELMVHCLFTQFLAPEEATVAAEGWGGDRFIAYRNGDDIAFIWATVWDSERDASEFYDQYKKLLSVKYGGSVTASTVYIEKRDRSVIVVEGLERDRIKRYVEIVWRGVTLEREPFQPLPLPSMIATH